MLILKNINNFQENSEQENREDILDFERKLQDNFNIIMRNTHESIKEMAINLRHNLESLLRKEFVIREEFDHGLESKANTKDFEKKVSTKAEHDDLLKNMSDLKLLRKNFENMLILLVELCNFNQEFISKPKLASLAKIQYL